MVNSNVLDRLVSTHLLSDAIDTFMLDGRTSERWTKKSEIIYEEQLTYFKKAAPKILEEVTPDVILNYLREAGSGRRLDKNGRRIPAPYQKQQAFRILRTFFRWCVDQEFLEKNPLSKIKIGRPDDRVHIPPTKEQSKLMLDSFDDSFLGKRNKALLYVYANTGARLCEILADNHNNRQGMADTDIDWKSGEIKIMGKGRRERIVGVQPNTLRAMFVYREAARKRWPVKTTTAFWLTEEGRPLQGDGFSQVLRRVTTQLGIEATTHDFRKYLCQTAHEGGMSPLEIMQITGHRSFKMVQHYTKASDGHAARQKLAKNSPVAGL